MKQSTNTGNSQPHLLSSPYPALQAVLPRLASIGVHAEDRPLFDDPDKVEEYLEGVSGSDSFHIVPVWAINHADLMSSEVVHWSYVQWLD